MVELLYAAGTVDLLVVVGSLALAFRVGDAIFSRFTGARTDTHGWECALFGTGLGLGVISYLTLLAGSLGLLRPLLFRFVFGTGLILSLPWFVRTYRVRLKPQLPSPKSWLSYPLIAIAVILVLASLVAALGPENEFDALNHHLGVARLYITSGMVVGTPSLSWSSHPLAVEMLFVWAWLVYSMLAAKVVHFALAILTGGGCFFWGRRCVSPGAGLLAAVLFISAPLVFYLSQSAYIDLGLAFFGTLTLAAVFRWLDNGAEDWMRLAGVYGGLAMGCKYMGLVALAAAAMAVVFVGSPSIGRGIRTRLRALGWMWGIALLVFLPWPVKNVVLVGNPVAPFLSDIIPTANFTADDYATLVSLSATWRGLPGNVVDYLRSPWLLTFRGDLFQGSPGPAFLVLFPFAAVLGWRRLRLRFLLLACLAGFAFLVAVTRNLRYFVVLFPWFSVAIACSIWPQGDTHGTAARWQRAKVLLSVLGLLCVTVQLPWIWILSPGPHPLTTDPAEIRLFRSEEERQTFVESRGIGAGGAEFYRHLQDLPGRCGLLALTPVYQALTDLTVFMPPNSSVSNEVAFQAIDIAQSGSGLVAIELGLPTPRFERFWKIQFAGSGQVSPDEAHPRFFYKEKEISLEVSTYRVEVRNEGEQFELLADLGSSRRVDSIRLLTARPGKVVYEVYSGAGLEVEGGWTARQVEQRALLRPTVTREQFLETCRRYRIEHAVIGDLPGAGFLRDYFMNWATEPDSAVRHARTIGSYRVFTLHTSGTQPSSRCR